MGFWGKLFGEKAAPQQEIAPAPSTERVGGSEAENVFFGEKTDSTAAWEAQQAAEQAAKASRERDMVAAAEAMRTAIDAGEKPADLPEEQLENERLTG